MTLEEALEKALELAEEATKIVRASISFRNDIEEIANRRNDTETDMAILIETLRYRLREGKMP